MVRRSRRSGCGDPRAAILRLLKAEAGTRDLLVAQSVRGTVRADGYLNGCADCSRFELAGNVVLHARGRPVMGGIVIQPFGREASGFEREGNTGIFFDRVPGP